MTVVNLKHQAHTHYIGRQFMYGKQTNLLANPEVMRHQSVEERSRVLSIFENHARTHIEVMQAIYVLPYDAVLGCFCKPLDCHGDIIIKLWKELHHVV
jgi:hypothetical protein